MNKRRIPVLLVLPAYLAALWLAFPHFDTLYTDGVSTARVMIGRLAMSAGVLPEHDGLLLGVYRPELPYAMSTLRGMEGRIGKRFDIISFYTTWGDREEDQFPSALLRAVDEHGAVAMITWEPWTTEFAINAGRDSDALRTDLAEISSGRYDAYIRAWAREAVVYGKPFFLRFAHEMNNPQYPWSTAAGNAAEEFIRAWRHVWSIFNDVGARNAIWVWSPKREAPRELYPGGAYVDWVGTGVFNYGTRGEAWYDFEYLFENVYRAAIAYDKPVMLAELASVNSGGSRPNWFNDVWRKLPSQYPVVRAVVLYDNPVDRTLPGQEIDWSIVEDDATMQTISSAITQQVFRK